MHAHEHPRTDPERWRDDAACRSMDTSVFFPGSIQPKVQAALAVCAGCPVQVDCLTAALAEEAKLTGQRPFGIRGGTTGRQRLDMLRRRKRAA